jgi:hypothetical protein
VPGLPRRHCLDNAPTTSGNAHKTPAAPTAKTPKCGLEIKAAPRGPYEEVGHAALPLPIFGVGIRIPHHGSLSPSTLSVFITVNVSGWSGPRTRSRASRTCRYSASALAWIHRRIAVDHFRPDLCTRSFACWARAWRAGRAPRRRPAGDLPGPGTGAGGRGGPFGGAVTGVRAGQAARAGGGPQAASNRFIHSAWRCQASGRCRVISPRPWRAVRAATSIRSRRSVAPRALL